MEKCIYGNECKECTHKVYRDCEGFRKKHAQSLCADIIPFDFRFKEEYRKSNSRVVYWSTNISNIKTYAAVTAYILNSKIKRLTTSQCLTLALDGGDILEKVIFLDIEKILGDTDKVTSTVWGFVEKMQLQGKRFFVYTTNTRYINQDWEKVQ